MTNWNVKVGATRTRNRTKWATKEAQSNANEFGNTNEKMDEVPHPNANEFGNERETGRSSSSNAKIGARPTTNKEIVIRAKLFCHWIKFCEGSINARIRIDRLA